MKLTFSKLMMASMIVFSFNALSVQKKNRPISLYQKLLKRNFQRSLSHYKIFNQQAEDYNIQELYLLLKNKTPLEELNVKELALFLKSIGLVESSKSVEKEEINGDDFFFLIFISDSKKEDYLILNKHLKLSDEIIAKLREALLLIN